MKTNYFIALVLGLISGYLSVNAPTLFGLSFVRDGIPNLSVLPGLLFGLAACLYFVFIFKLSKWPNYIGWIIISILAYNIAFWATFFLVLILSHYFNATDTNLLYNNPAAYLAFFVGGFLGAFLTILGLKWLVVKFTMRHVLMLSLCGAVLGLSGLIPNLDGSDSTNYLPLFLIWQAGVMFLIMRTAENYLAPEMPKPA